MESQTGIHPLIMDIHNSVVDSHNAVMDIND